MINQGNSCCLVAFKKYSLNLPMTKTETWLANKEIRRGEDTEMKGSPCCYSHKKPNFREWWLNQHILKMKTIRVSTLVACKSDHSPSQDTNLTAEEKKLDLVEDWWLGFKQPVESCPHKSKALDGANSKKAPLRLRTSKWETNPSTRNAIMIQYVPAVLHLVKKKEWMDS